jgi:hypothetical protein
MKELTADILRELLCYNPTSGLFIWRARKNPAWNGRWAGARAGFVSPGEGGRIQIAIFGRKHWAHRLAWLYMTGEWPIVEVDHKNLRMSDNRFDNLRLATHAENNQNRPTPLRNTSGYKGVTWHKMLNKWMAQIDANGRHIYIGVFVDRKMAAHAYDAAAKLHHGEFARLNFPGD